MKMLAIYVCIMYIFYLALNSLVGNAVQHAISSGLGQ